MSADASQLKELFGDIVYNQYIMDAYSVQLCGNELRQMQDNDLNSLFLNIQLLESCDCQNTKH